MPHPTTTIRFTINNTFLLDPRNKPLLQGQKGQLYRGNDGVLVLMTLFLGLLGGGLLFIIILSALFNSSNEAALAANGIDTEATILDHYTVEQTDKSGSKSISRYVLVMQFNKDGKRYSITKDVTAKTYHQFEKGETISLRYLPDNPNLTQIPGEAHTDIQIWVGLGLLYVAGAAVMGFLAIRRRYRKQRLEREGVRLPGRITQVNRKKDRHGIVVEIQYTFSAPNGSVKKGKDSAIRNDLSNQPLPPVNRQVAVLYVNEQLFTAL
jgi:hypothetical protein